MECCAVEGFTSKRKHEVRRWASAAFNDEEMIPIVGWAYYRASANAMIIA